MAMLNKPKSKHLTLRLEDELHEGIAAAAQEDRRPVSNLIRNVLADWLANRSVGERAERAV